MFNLVLLFRVPRIHLSPDLPPLMRKKLTRRLGYMSGKQYLLCEAVAGRFKVEYPSEGRRGNY